MARRRRLVLALHAAVALLLTGAVVALWAGDVLRDIELETVDTRFAVRGEREATDVVVVGIDAKTFETIGRFPFSRRFHARVIERLTEAGAKVIAYDVQFTEPSGRVGADNALIEAAAAADRIVLGTSEVGKGGTSNVFGGEEVLRDIGARSGSVNLPNDPGGVVRRMLLDDAGLRGFSVVAADLALGRPVPGSAFGADGTAWIDYPGPPRTIETVSFGDVAEGRVDAARFRDRVVVVGATAPSLKDVFPTAVGDEDLMSGPEIQAAAIQTLIDGVPLRAVARWVDALVIVLLGLLAPLTMRAFGPLRAVAAAVAVGVIYAAVAQLLFNAGHIVAGLYPLLALGLGTVGALGVAVAVGAFERERVRDLFARFVPEAVVDDVLARADEGLRLGGERKIVTVLFSDVRGFTTYTETRPAEEVVGVLNHYLTEMCDVILDHGGTLVSFMGDGIMAAFGAPLEQVDHADRAYEAACEMAGSTLDRVNDWIRANGHGEGFQIGIGLNSGPVMAGNVGSARRLEYTTIGDATNTAARLESMTKGSGHTVFVGDSTRAMMTRHTGDLVHVADMDVRGRQAKVSVWAPRQKDGE